LLLLLLRARRRTERRKAADGEDKKERVSLVTHSLPFHRKKDELLLVRKRKNT